MEPVRVRPPTNTAYIYIYILEENEMKNIEMGKKYRCRDGVPVTVLAVGA